VAGRYPRAIAADSAKAGGIISGIIHPGALPEICGPLHRGFLTKGSNCGSHMHDQIANALRQFDDFAFSPQFEIDLIVACRGVIDRLF